MPLHGVQVHAFLSWLIAVLITLSHRSTVYLQLVGVPILHEANVIFDAGPPSLSGLCPHHCQVFLAYLALTDLRAPIFPCHSLIACHGFERRKYVIFARLAGRKRLLSGHTLRLFLWGCGICVWLTRTATCGASSPAMTLTRQPATVPGAATRSPRGPNT